jgi:hypothetical protein
MSKIETTPTKKKLSTKNQNLKKKVKTLKVTFKKTCKPTLDKNLKPIKKIKNSTN